MKLLIVLLIILVAAPRTALAAGFRMHGATGQQWQWARDAQQHVPLPDVAFRIENGSPLYAPIVLNPGAAENLLILPLSSIPGNRRNGWTAQAEHGLFLHELGHAYDFADMTPARRAAFKRLVGTSCAWWAKHCITDRWVSGPGVTVDVAPGEMFAEEYAACALGMSQQEYQNAGFNTYGWVPPPGTDEDPLCALMAAG